MLPPLCWDRTAPGRAAGDQMQTAWFGQLDSVILWGGGTLQNSDQILTGVKGKGVPMSALWYREGFLR